MNRILKISGIFVISTLYVSQVTAITVSDKANKLAQENIIIDSHIDVPYRLEEKWVDVTKATTDGDFDYPRAKQGGLNAPFMSIYIPASLDSSATDFKYSIHDNSFPLCNYLWIHLFI